MENIQLRSAGSAALHLQLRVCESEFPGQRQADYGAGGSSVDEDSNGMATQRTGGVEVPDAAARESDLSKTRLREKSRERQK